MSKQSELPKYVYPGNLRFEVKLVPMEDHEYGETIGQERLIKVSSNPDKTDSRWITLFHEYLHAVIHTSGLTHVLPYDQSQGVNVEEALVSMLEQNLFHLIDVKRLGKRSPK